MSSARPALSPAERTADDPGRLRPGDLSRAHPPPPPGAPLHASHPRRDPRGHPDHAAARQRARGQGVRAEAWRLDRGAAAPPAGGRAVRRWHLLPLRGVQHRIVHRPGVRGTVWIGDRRGRRSAALRRRRAPHVDRRVSDFLRREAQRDLEAASRRAAEAARRRDQAHLGARPVEPLGLVLDHRRAVVFLAADPRAAVRAGLSRRA